MRTACVVIALLALACCGLPLSGQSPNPVPLINNPLSPTSVAPGGPAFTLTVNGTGFVSVSVVKWNGSSLTTHFVNSSQLTATVPAGNIATASTAAVTVANPAPGGGTSNVTYLEITNTASTLTFTTINPNTGPVEQPYTCTLASGGVDCTVLAFPVFAVGDFNGDGKLDIAIPQNTGNTVSVELGNGDGTFGTAVDYAVGSSPNFVLAADFNGDGKLDLAVTSGTDESVSVLLGNGDGTFQSAQIASLGSGNTNSPIPKYLAAGDFNGDGKLDLVVAFEQTLGIFLGNGDGTFQAPIVLGSMQLGPILDPWNSITGVAVGDFSGDGKLDLALALADLPNASDFHPNFPGVSVLLGNGDGTFQAAKLLGLNQPVNGIAAADVNGDGKLDLMLGPSSTNPEIVLGNGDGTFQSPLQTGFLVGKVFAIGDVKANGKLDMVFPDATNGLISVALGNGDGTLQNPPLNITAAVPDGAIVAGDFNGDGKMDFVLTNFLSTKNTASTVTVLLQGSFPSFSGTPNPLVFPDQALNTTSASQAITLTNGGLAPFSISSVQLAGANPGQFSQTNNCIVTLAPGATCQVSLTFAPTQQGSPTAVVSVTDDAPGSPQAISVQASVVVPPPPPPAAVVSLAPSTLTFPSQYVGTSGLPQTVTVTNSGNASLTVTAATPSTADFGVLSNCNSPVAVGSSCTIGVFFDPTAGGTRTGTLKITDNAGNSPQTVALTGSGLDFSMTPGSAASATVSCRANGELFDCRGAGGWVCG